MKKFNKIVLGGLLVGTMLTSGFTSFASRDNRGEDLNSRRVELTEEEKIERANSLKERITGKFEDGFITEEHYNQVLLDIEEGRKPIFSGQGRRKPDSGFSNRGAGLTEEQRVEKSNSLKERITGKFEDGFITEEHYNQVLLDIEEGRKPMFSGQGRKNGRNRSNSGFCHGDNNIITEK